MQSAQIVAAYRMMFVITAVMTFFLWNLGPLAFDIIIHNESVLSEAFSATYSK